MEKKIRSKIVHEDCNHNDLAQVLQEAKINFMATNIGTKKLVTTLTNCIFILLRDERLAPNQATDLFFHITRLFQYKDKDGLLRRLIYIAIKALSKQADNVYLATSSLTTDVDPSRNDPEIRAAALRALCQILDASTIISAEPYLKLCIVDEHPVVASAALTSLIKISSINTEIVQRCTNEIQEALSSTSPMVQYHALGLRYNSCKNDKLAVSRLITNCIQNGLNSPLAICLLIKIITNSINESEEGDKRPYCDYIKSHLNHESEMVQYEAANAVINLGDTSTKLRASAVAQLRNFLTSPKSAMRFAALRALNEFNSTMSTDCKFWSTHRVGNLCKLHLLNKHHKLGDNIVGVLDFSDSKSTCVKYTIIWQCEEIQRYELKYEFVFGFKRKDFMITIPKVDTKAKVLHCVLSFLYYVADEASCAKTSFKDPAGTVDLGPSELETKVFGCDLPIAVYI